MQAAVFVEAHSVAVRDVPPPTPRDGEALIKVHHAGVCGSDLSIIAGKHPRARHGLIPGHEFCGEIVDLQGGSNPAGLAVGDHVVLFPLVSCGQCHACRNGREHICRTLRMIGIDFHGGFAQYVTTPLSHLYKVPRETAPDGYALVEPLAVALHSVEMSGASDTGDPVAILGGGPIGMLIALTLRTLGFDHVTLFEREPFRIQVLTELGFRVLNPEEQDAQRRLLDLTDGDGVGLLFECSGARPAALGMTEMVRPAGTIMLVSVFHEPTPLDLRAINFKEHRLIGVRVYTRANFERAITLLAEGRIPLDKIVTHHFALSRLAEDYATIARRENMLKVLIDCGR